MLNADIHGATGGNIWSPCVSPYFGDIPWYFHGISIISLWQLPQLRPVKTPGKDISIQPPEGTGLAGTEEVAETMLGPTAFPRRKGCSVGLGMFSFFFKCFIYGW